MKFGHAFKEALEAEPYPQHWVERAIPYRQLKKILGKVREELIRKGYDPDTLHKLLQAHNAHYNLVKDDADSRLLRPNLIVRPGPRSLAAYAPADLARLRVSVDSAIPGDLGEPGRRLGDSRGHDDQGADWVKIPLDSDAKFFHVLQTDVDELDSLHKDETNSMNTDINILGNEIAQVAKPKKTLIRFSKSDLYRWREIFDLYLSAQIFFSTTEASGGTRNSAKAQQQLVWFQNEVNKRQLHHKFKIGASREAYARFTKLNAQLLQNLRFQELNQTAVTKIIKKFDKRTSLGVKSEFPRVMKSATFFSESVAKSICAELSKDVVSVVPQVVDYSCPVCLGLCWLPIRLDCHHLFCIRCMIKMQNRNKDQCPLCREAVIQKATEANIDMRMVKYLEQWFPKETSEKQKYNEMERRRELWGDEFAEQQPCVVM